MFSIENQKLTSNKSSTGLTVNSTNSRLSIGWELAENSRSGCYIKGTGIWYYSRWEWRHRHPYWRLWSQQFAWRYSKQNWTIVYDTYDLCAYHKEGKLQAFNVAMLKTILRHFEVPFRAKDRKTDLIRLLTEVIQECNCWKESTVAFIKQTGQQYFLL